MCNTRNASYETNRATVNAPAKETSLNSEIRHTGPTVNFRPFTESIMSSRRIPNVCIRTKTSRYFIKMEVSSERASSETSYCQIYYFVHTICVQRARTLERYTTCRRVPYIIHDIRRKIIVDNGPRTRTVYRRHACNDIARIYRARGCPSSGRW